MVMNAQEIRQRYLADKVNTATPAQLIVMLYDRLAIDLERATAAQSDDDPAAASAPLLHAQQIVAELHSQPRHLQLGRRGRSGRALPVPARSSSSRRAARPTRARLRAVATIVADLRSAWSEAAVLVTNLDGPAADRPAVAGAWVG